MAERHVRGILSAAQSMHTASQLGTAHRSTHLSSPCLAQHHAHGPWHRMPQHKHSMDRNTNTARHVHDALAQSAGVQQHKDTEHMYRNTTTDTTTHTKGGSRDAGRILSRAHLQRILRSVFFFHWVYRYSLAEHPVHPGRFQTCFRASRRTHHHTHIHTRPLIFLEFFSHILTAFPCISPLLRVSDLPRPRLPPLYR